ncbi:MAG: hypothetical protein HQL93_00795 [Magnetococcales bacterium]|nr:hypothetical protein [Magnetococcales bacterium]
MVMRGIGLLIFLGLFWIVEAKASEWTPYPLIRKESKGRDQVRIQVKESSVTELAIYPPDPSTSVMRMPMSADGATIKVNQGGGNYHWIAVQTDSPRETFTLATVHYFSVPGVSPAAMLAAPKSRLEIIPQPLPREFATYRAGERWSFQLRFDQRVVPDQLVILFTPGQPEQRLFTDGKGILKVVFPPFGEQKSAKKDRRPVQPFQLVVERVEGVKKFTTVFQHEYGPAPLVGRDPVMGWLVACLGMGAGFLLWRKPRGGAV